MTCLLCRFRPVLTLPALIPTLGPSCLTSGLELLLNAVFLDCPIVPPVSLMDFPPSQRLLLPV